MIDEELKELVITIKKIDTNVAVLIQRFDDNEKLVKERFSTIRWVMSGLYTAVGSIVAYLGLK